MLRTDTSSSGIWGTVWLECVPPVSIEQVVPITTEDRSGFRVEVGVRSGSRLGVDNDMAVGSKVEVTLSSKKPGCADITREQPVAGGGALTVVAGLELPPACRHLWSPKSPFLYNLTIALTQGGRVVDTVASYAGLRTYTVGAVDGVIRPLLNGKFVYQMATLDQGFWPDGNCKLTLSRFVALPSLLN